MALVLGLASLFLSVPDHTDAGHQGGGRRYRENPMHRLVVLAASNRTRLQSRRAAIIAAGETA